MSLTIDGRPTAPPPARALFAGNDDRWRERGAFALAVLRGLGIVIWRLVARRPFATGLAVAFAWGAITVVGNLTRQPAPHPAPLFTRAAERAPETTGTLPQAQPRPVEAERVAAPPAPAVAPRPQAQPAPAPAPQAQPRDQRAIVRDVQTELMRRGAELTADGVAGPRTERAIRAFEREARIPETGQASEALLERLRAAPVRQAAPQPAAQPPALQRQTVPAPQPQTQPQPAPRPQAEAGRPVEPRIMGIVQRRLADMGYMPGNVGDPAFRRAVERFQRDAGLEPNGTVDRAMVDRLAAATGRIE